MPKIYEYMGIVFYFYSDEHEPIHIHAQYGNVEVKVSFFIKEGKIYRTSYKNITGKLTAPKEKQLREFVELYKYKFVEHWQTYFVWHQKIKFSRHTKRINNK